MDELYHTRRPINYPLHIKTFPLAKPGHKYCVTCEKELPFASFHKMAASPDGYRPSCKACRKAKELQSKIPAQRPLNTRICIKCEQEKEYIHFNRSKNSASGYTCICRNCQSDYNRQHRINNIESYRLRSHIKNTKPENKARKMERHRQRSATDSQYLESRKRQRQSHYQNHKEQARDFAPRRKARILNASVGEVDYAAILERDGYFCYLCQKPIDPRAKKKSAGSLTFDHVVPLQPRSGEPQGSHSSENLKVAHLVCNVRKGNRPLEILTPFDRRGIE